MGLVDRERPWMIVRDCLYIRVYGSDKWHANYMHTCGGHIVITTQSSRAKFTRQTRTGYLIMWIDRAWIKDASKLTLRRLLMAAHYYIHFILVLHLICACETTFTCSVTRISDLLKYLSLPINSRFLVLYQIKMRLHDDDFLFIKKWYY